MEYVQLRNARSTLLYAGLASSPAAQIEALRVPRMNDNDTLGLEHLKINKGKKKRSKRRRTQLRPDSIAATDPCGIVQSKTQTVPKAQSRSKDEIAGNYTHNSFTDADDLVKPAAVDPLATTTESHRIESSVYKARKVPPWVLTNGTGSIRFRNMRHFQYSLWDGRYRFSPQVRQSLQSLMMLIAHQKDHQYCRRKPVLLKACEKAHHRRVNLTACAAATLLRLKVKVWLRNRVHAEVPSQRRYPRILLCEAPGIASLCLPRFQL